MDETIADVHSDIDDSILEEVFFGPISDREVKKSKKFLHRKTELFKTCPFFKVPDNSLVLPGEQPVAVVTYVNTLDSVDSFKGDLFEESLERDIHCLKLATEISPSDVQGMSVEEDLKDLCTISGKTGDTEIDLGHEQLSLGSCAGLNIVMQSDASHSLVENSDGRSDCFQKNVSEEKSLNSTGILSTLPMHSASGSSTGPNIAGVFTSFELSSENSLDGPTSSVIPGRVAEEEPRLVVLASQPDKNATIDILSSDLIDINSSSIFKDFIIKDDNEFVATKQNDLVDDIASTRTNDTGSLSSVAICGSGSQECMGSSLEDSGNISDIVVHGDLDRSETFPSGSSHGYVDINPNTSHLTVPESELSNDDSVSGANNCFNDTVEEMEMLLKYGMDYIGETNFDGVLPPVPKTCLSAVEEKKEDDEDEVISPRKTSVASTISSEAFVPNVNSTYSSDLKTRECTSPIGNARQHGMGMESVNAPPPKPPRNIVPSKLSDLVDGKLETDELTETHSDDANITEKPIKKEEVTTPRMKKPFVLTAKSFSHIPRPCSVTKHNSVSKSKTEGSLKRGKQVGLNKVQPLIVSDVKSTVTKSAKQTQSFKCFTPQAKVVKTAGASAVFLTPQPVAQKHLGSQVRDRMHPVHKVLSRTCRANRNIMSPLAKYLKENPPPPLIATVKPKYAITPEKMARSTAVNSNVENTGVTKCSALQGRSTLHSEGDDHVAASGEGKKCKLKIPTSFYSPALYTLENKENSTPRSSRREIVVDKPQKVVKHKGHVLISKNRLEELRGKTGTSAKDCSSSMMEVSVYEPHEACHTYTLH